MLAVLLAQETVNDSGWVGDSIVQLDVTVLSRLGGIILPIVVAIVTKKLAASWVKAVILAVLATVTGLVATAIETQGTVDIAIWVDGVLSSAIIAWASYAAFWKPTGIAPKVQNATANFGIGGGGNPYGGVGDGG